MDTTIRTLLKAISWRIIGTLSLFIIGWIITGAIAVAATIAVTELIVRIVLYWLHELMWSRSTWGRESARLPSPRSFSQPPPVEKKPVRSPTRRVYT